MPSEIHDRFVRMVDRTISCACFDQLRMVVGSDRALPRPLEECGAVEMEPQQVREALGAARFLGCGAVRDGEEHERLRVKVCPRRLVRGGGRVLVVAVVHVHGALVSAREPRTGGEQAVWNLSLSAGSRVEVDGEQRDLLLSRRTRSEQRVSSSIATPREAGGWCLVLLASIQRVGYALELETVLEMEQLRRASDAVSCCRFFSNVERDRGRSSARHRDAAREHGKVDSPTRVA